MVDRTELSEVLHLSSPATPKDPTFPDPAAQPLTTRHCIASSFAQQPGDANGRIVRSPLVRRLILSSPQTGADTLIYLAQGTPGVDFPSGEYFVKRKPARANKQAYDADLAARLWDRSVSLTTES